MKFINLTILTILAVLSGFLLGRIGFALIEAPFGNNGMNLIIAAIFIWLNIIFVIYFYLKGEKRILRIIMCVFITLSVITLLELAVFEHLLSQVINTKEFIAKMSILHKSQDSGYYNYNSIFNKIESNWQLLGLQQLLVNAVGSVIIGGIALLFKKSKKSQTIDSSNKYLLKYLVFAIFILLCSSVLGYINFLAIAEYSGYRMVIYYVIWLMIIFALYVYCRGITSIIKIMFVIFITCTAVFIITMRFYDYLIVAMVDINIVGNALQEKYESMLINDTGRNFIVFTAPAMSFFISLFVGFVLLMRRFIKRKKS
jgi:hypothetical protein